VNQVINVDIPNRVKFTGTQIALDAAGIYIITQDSNVLYCLRDEAIVIAKTLLYLADLDAPSEA
jgi:hypothetical protein